MTHTIYLEKKAPHSIEAQELLALANTFLGVTALQQVRILHRYDVEGLTADQFDLCVRTILANATDEVHSSLPAGGDAVFATEYLPGQYDQKADMGAVAIQFATLADLPTVQTARVFMLYGNLSESDITKVKKHIINHVESRETSPTHPATLQIQYPTPGAVEVMEGFRGLDTAGLAKFIADCSLSMDTDDAACIRDYFITEQRDPTITEIRVLDTYWSDHCRHTTFFTHFDSVTFDDPVAEAAYAEYLRTKDACGDKKPLTLMNLATIVGKHMKKTGRLDKLDESEEVNACTVKIKVKIDGKEGEGERDWLLYFKNETHNHPTEMEPFGGAATCIGGGIRDPLSGRAYPFAAIRLTGAADPTAPLADTLAGKLPQRNICTSAAAGYSSYGNQVGAASGIVDEIYHPGYLAKRMELGAVLAAAPADYVVRKQPVPGDVIMLVGGRTGRDGVGGASGSSKSHTSSSLELGGAEVQKGAPALEYRIIRLFRDPHATRLIKRCNDFGAGGVSVAIGELAAGLDINLNAVPLKYPGLSPTEIAISESQERMAVVIAAADADAFCRLAHGENLECTPIATVSETPRLVIRYDGKPVVDLARDFLDSAGATKHTHIKVAAPQDYAKPAVTDFAAGYKALAADMNVASKAALSNMFDSTIGGGSVTMPYGGATQRTPIQALAYKIPVQDADTSTCAVMAWGYNPYISSADQYAGAYLAVVESVCRAIATGASREDMYLTFQEYFERLRGEAVRWGKPLAALLGAFTAQMGLGMAAVGGKDSMSGTFEDIDVPPALISFAVTTAETGDIISPEFKKAGSRVIWLRPQLDGRGLPTTESLLANFDTITRMAKAGKILSMSTPTYGGVAEAVMKAAAGNNIGFAFDAGITTSEIFAYAYGSFIVELAEGATPIGTLLGKTTESPIISHGSAELAISEVMDISEHRLAPVYGKPFMPTSTPCETAKSDVKLWESATTKVAKPRVLIPIVPGSVGDYDAAKAFSLAGAETEIFVVQSHTAADIATSQAEFAKKLDGAHILWLPGGFSPVDTPEGGGKLMAAFLSAPVVKDAMSRFMDSEKLIGSVGDGFLALVQLGILPTGRFAPPSMSYAATGEHVSGIGASKIHSNSSPWFANAQIGEWVSLPVSHQRGTFVMDGGTFDTLMANGQIAITFDKQIDALTSPNGRIMGMLSRADRMGDGLYKNVPGNYGIDVFGAAVKYFK